MKYLNTLFLTIALSVSLLAQNINLEQIASGFSSPLEVSHAGDDRLFIVERGGAIKILNTDGSVNPEPFLDINPIVFNASNNDERGLLGIAFHPDYANNGYFFLNYTDNNENTNVVRYQVDGSDSNKANPDSRELIIEIEQPTWNHNGGCIRFGHDGYLYIGMGDGGSSNDPWNNSQKRDTHLGKMLRLDVDNGLPYTIPADNPFVNDENTLDEIWAIGLRNPWRFSFDKETGDLWIGDVGQGALEEIDFQSADSPGGENYGWRCYEGTEFTGNNPQEDCEGEFIDPVFEVQHQGFSGPCSITGGHVYRGTKYADLAGKYICADYCTGDFYVVENNDGTFTGNQVAQFNNDVSTFGEDSSGELYIASFTSGTIYKVLGEVLNNVEVIPNVSSVAVFPNPATDKTTLTIETKQIVPLEINLLDITGKEILNIEKEVNGSFSTTIDLQGMPAGTYILNVNNNAGLVTKKIIKL